MENSNFCEFLPPIINSHKESKGTNSHKESKINTSLEVLDNQEQKEEFIMRSEESLENIRTTSYKTTSYSYKNGSYESQRSIKRTSRQNNSKSSFSTFGNASYGNSSYKNSSYERSFEAFPIDIFSIHEKIKKACVDDAGGEKETIIKNIKQRLKDLEWIKNNSKDNIEIINAKREIFINKKELSRIRNIMSIDKYEKRINPIIEEYKNILYSPINSSFLQLPLKSFSNENSSKGNGNNVPFGSNDKLKKLEYIFYTIAQDYINIKPPTLTKYQTTCQECGNYMEGKGLRISEDGVYICTNCGLEIDILDEALSFKDAMRINLITRYSYSRKGHMKEAIDKHQCRQHTEIPQEIYTMLQEECEKHGFKDISQDHVIRFIKERGYSSYYEDVNYIYYTFTKKTPPDLSPYVDELLRLNDIFENEYEKVLIDNGIPGVDLSKRSSALNVQYKLYILLKKLGYICSIDEFFTLKTRDKFIDHDLIAAEIFRRLHWQWSPNI